MEDECPKLRHTAQASIPGVEATTSAFGKSINGPRYLADARWLAFLRKVGKAPEQLAKVEFKVALPQADDNTASGQAEH